MEDDYDYNDDWEENRDFSCGTCFDAKILPCELCAGSGVTPCNNYCTNVCDASGHPKCLCKGAGETICPDCQ